MTSGVTFGPKPKGFNINLPIDADFVAGLSLPPSADPFDPAAEISLRFTTKAGSVVSWVAEHDPDDDHRVFWVVDEIVVGALLAANPLTCRLHYELGTADLLWDVAGRVERV